MRQALQAEVATPLVALVPDIDLLSNSSPRQEAGEAMHIAKAEIATAVEDIDALILGLPPSDLGQGQLMTAIARVVASSPVPVRIVAGPGVGFTPAVETTLYYVCCEAIANAVKHSGASSISCRITVADSRAKVAVRDDGRGGADLLGSGLQGLQDRVESMHGHLSVSSPPDGGTTVTALVPLS
jgi:signal transduction histidine kinase